jgi:hypothetical protein
LKIKATLFFVIFYLIAFTSIAQTGIGTTTPDPSGIVKAIPLDNV